MWQQALLIKMAVLSSFNKDVTFPSFYEVFPHLKPKDYDKKVAEAAYKAERDEIAFILGSAKK